MSRTEIKKKIVLVLKEGEGEARGTKSAKEIQELCEENWHNIQEKHGEASNDGKTELEEIFNDVYEGLGDVLFGGELDDFR